MEDERWAIQLMEYLSDQMTGKDREAFEGFLKEEPEYRERFESLKAAWQQLQDHDLPEPSESMDDRFYRMLYEQTARTQKSERTFMNRLQGFLAPLWGPQLAYKLLLLGLGVGIGYYWNSTDDTVPVENNTIAVEETEAVRERLVLTLLEQPSANQRLQGVSEANKIRKVDERVIRALLETLNADPNVNVRLAAIESLTNYVGNPIVREGLVQAIVHQESPIVQVTLANLMVALQEKKSVEPFKKLIRSKTLDKRVREKLETSIESII